LSDTIIREPSRREVTVVFALSANFLAFYLGAIFIERSGIFFGVAVFLLTSLTGTIMASGMENFMASVTERVCCVCGDRIARYSAERLYFGI
jgi:hypothetical protein